MKHKVSEHTMRFVDIGLVTRATPKFKYARVRMDGKVHIVTDAIIHWNSPPFPELSFVLACGGRQPRSLIPGYLAAYPEDQCCVKCFKMNTTRMDRQLQRRELIVDVITGWEGEFTNRDIWKSTRCSYSLAYLCILEMRQAGLITVVSEEGKQPLRMMVKKS